MNLSASVSRYQKFLIPLMKWKILDTNSLREISDYRGNYFSFCQMINNLKRRGLVCWEPLADGRKKVIYLTREAQKEIHPNNPYFIDERIIFHDAIVSNIVRSFLQKKYFHNCQLPHEYKGQINWNFSNVIEPDAILFGLNKNINFNIAIEIELTQKSKDRIIEKVDAYVKSEFFNSAIYIFNKRNVFDAYVKLVREIYETASSTLYSKGICQKIFLLFEEDLLKFPLDFSQNPLFVNNKERRFCEVMDA